MYIAQELRKKNIAEYILYMWQVEDTIRAFGCQLSRIRREYIEQFDYTDEQKEEEDAAAAKVAQEQEQADAQSGIDWWYIGVAVGFVLGLMAVAFFRGRKK